MRLLLDTHVLLWCLADAPCLSESVRITITDGENIVFVSAVSAWEIAIKKALGKLEAPDALEEAIAVSRFEPLPIKINHALHAGGLPRHHDDPFDRMLIAQSMMEGLILVTRNNQFSAYGVPILAA